MSRDRGSARRIKARLFGESVPAPRVGKYVLAEPLGEGAAGTVYRAYDPDLDRRVALKLLREQLEREQGIERTLREARALARLNHPNVVTIFDVVSPRRGPISRWS